MGDHARAKPHLFPELLRTLFEIVLFEECSNQWSLSRPMLSLILVNEQIYNDLKVGVGDAERDNVCSRGNRAIILIKDHCQCDKCQNQPLSCPWYVFRNYDFVVVTHLSKHIISCMLVSSALRLR